MEKQVKNILSRIRKINKIIQQPSFNKKDNNENDDDSEDKPEEDDPDDLCPF